MRKLQAHVENAEIQWSEKLRAKDVEIEVLKSQQLVSNIKKKRISSLIYLSFRLAVMLK